MRKYLSFLLIILLAGCDTEKRAMRQQNHIKDNYPAILAEACADEYPCTTDGTPDTTYLPADSAKYLDAIAELNLLLDGMSEAQDSLIAALRIDTTCQRYEAAIAAQSREIASLRSKLLAKPPVIYQTQVIRDTVESEAKIAVERIRADEAVKALVKEQSRADKLQKGRNGWRIFGISLSLLILLILAAYLYGKYRGKK